MQQVADVTVSWPQRVSFCVSKGYGLVVAHCVQGDVRSAVGVNAGRLGLTICRAHFLQLVGIFVQVDPTCAVDFVDGCAFAQRTSKNRVVATTPVPPQPRLWFKPRSH